MLKLGSAALALSFTMVTLARPTPQYSQLHKRSPPKVPFQIPVVNANLHLNHGADQVFYVLTTIRQADKSGGDKEFKLLIDTGASVTWVYSNKFEETMTKAKIGTTKPSDDVLNERMSNPAFHRVWDEEGSEGTNPSEFGTNPNPSKAPSPSPAHSINEKGPLEVWASYKHALLAPQGDLQVPFEMAYIGEDRAVYGHAAVRTLAIEGHYTTTGSDYTPPKEYIESKSQLIGCVDKVTEKILEESAEWDGTLGLGPKSTGAVEIGFKFGGHQEDQAAQAVTTSNWAENAKLPGKDGHKAGGVFTIDFQSARDKYEAQGVLERAIKQPGAGLLTPRIVAESKNPESSITFGQCLCNDENDKWIELEKDCSLVSESGKSRCYMVSRKDRTDTHFVFDTGSPVTVVPKKAVDEYWKTQEANEDLRIFYSVSHKRWWFNCNMAHELKPFELTVAGIKTKIPGRYMLGPEATEKDEPQVQGLCISNVQEPDPEEKLKPFILGVQFYLTNQVCHDSDNLKVKFCKKVVLDGFLKAKVEHAQMPQVAPRPW